MCSESFNLTETFLQMHFQGIKIVLAFFFFFDSFLILRCTEVLFVDDVGDGTEVPFGSLKVSSQSG